MRYAFISGAAASILATAAFGGVWSEIGDAGQTASTAQATIGTGELKYIDGELKVGDDVDIYCIRITDVPTFYANSGASFDAQIFLFTMAGIALTMADQNGGGNQGILSGTFVPGPGDYLLAISRYNNDPVDASNNLIWNNTPRNTERAPDGPSTSNLLHHWNDGGPSTGGKYKIDLKGATFCPTPGAVSLLAFAGALAARRRRAR